MTSSASAARTSSLPLLARHGEHGDSGAFTRGRQEAAASGATRRLAAQLVGKIAPGLATLAAIRAGLVRRLDLVLLVSLYHGVARD